MGRGHGGRTPIDIDESRLTRHARGFVGLVLKTGDGLFDGLDLKTLREGFVGLVFKTRHGRFGGLGLKTIDDGFNQFGPQRGAEDTWLHLIACIEEKRSREDTGYIGSMKKNLDYFIPRSIWDEYIVQGQLGK